MSVADEESESEAGSEVGSQVDEESVASEEAAPEDIVAYERGKLRKRERNSTTKYLTPYEKAQVIGRRAKEIAQGSKPLVAIGDVREPRKLAELELIAHVMPGTIRRYVSAKEYEEWEIKDLRIHY